ncbi:hypothetical protein HGM15179_017872, partial [Zosterops borbonicus]
TRIQILISGFKIGRGLWMADSEKKCCFKRKLFKFSAKSEYLCYLTELTS